MPSDNGVVEAHRSSLLERVVFSKTTNVSEKEHGVIHHRPSLGTTWYFFKIVSDGGVPIKYPKMDGL